MHRFRNIPARGGSITRRAASEPAGSASSASVRNARRADDRDAGREHNCATPRGRAANRSDRSPAPSFGGLGA